MSSNSKSIKLSRDILVDSIFVSANKNGLQVYGRFGSQQKWELLSPDMTLPHRITHLKFVAPLTVVLATVEVFGMDSNNEEVHEVFKLDWRVEQQLEMKKSNKPSFVREFANMIAIVLGAIIGLLCVLAAPSL